MTALNTLTQTQQIALRAFCERNSVKRLAFFGSFITEAFGAESDIDVLVEFMPGKTPGYGFFTMVDELEDILERPVDLTTPGGLHPLLKTNILRSAQTYYEALSRKHHPSVPQGQLP